MNSQYNIDGDRRQREMDNNTTSFCGVNKTVKQTSKQQCSLCSVHSSTA